MIRTHLCIGGPLDGRRHDDREWLHVRAEPKPGTFMVERVRYRECDLGGVAVWAPEEMGEREVLRRLVEGYRHGSQASAPACCATRNGIARDLRHVLT